MAEDSELGDRVINEANENSHPHTHTLRHTHKLTQTAEARADYVTVPWHWADDLSRTHTRQETEKSNAAPQRKNRDAPRPIRPL